MTKDDETKTPGDDSGPTAAAPFLDENGGVYEIPEEGSLALLAMGYAGIMLWREKRNGKARMSS